MVGIVERLRQTRADMLGTPDEAHYWDCVEAAAVIEKLRAALKEAALILAKAAGRTGEEEFAVAAIVCAAAAKGGLQ